MKNKTIPFIFLIGVLLVLGNIFYNPTSTTVVKSNTYLTPANPAFDDDNFYKCITDSLRVSSDTNVTDEQLASITSLECFEKNITSTKGLEKLTGLNMSLILRDNPISSIDISNSPDLRILNIAHTNITELDVTNNTKLSDLSVQDRNVDIVGLDRNITKNLYYYKSYIFEDYDLVASQDITEYDLTVGNTVSKLEYCPNPTGEELCIIANMYSEFPLGFGMLFSGMIVNDETIDQEKIMQILYNNQEYADENGNFIIADLNEGLNVIKGDFEGTIYTINVYRKTLEEETSTDTTDNNVEEPKDTKEDTKEVITNNSNNNTSQNKQFDILKEVPNTGILLSISLSIVSVLLITLMYIKYYSRKKANS